MTNQPEFPIATKAVQLYEIGGARYVRLTSAVGIKTPGSLRAKIVLKSGRSVIGWFQQFNDRRSCKFCKTPFDLGRSDQVYCADTCRVKDCQKRSRTKREAKYF